MKIFLCPAICVVFCLFFLPCFADPSGELSIGDHCPDLEFKDVLYAQKTTYKLSEFRGKLVLIDFWATWCSPCVKSLPNLQALQQLYKKEIIVLLITLDDRQKVVHFFDRNPVGKNIHLPVITNDTVFLKNFPHNVIPHDVWIDTSGKVMAFTAPEAINNASILDALNGKPPMVNMKIDRRDFDEGLPMLNQLSGNKSLYNRNAIYSSSLTGEQDGLGGFLVLEPFDSIFKMLVINQGVDAMYNYAFTTPAGYSIVKSPNMYMIMQSRRVLELKDSSLCIWIGKNKQNYKPRPFFCYEYVFPRQDSADFNTLAVDDLNRLFGERYGIEAIKEIRKVKCWALTKTGSPVPIAKQRTPAFSYADKYGYMYNTPITYFMFYMITNYMQLSPIPIIDKTGLDQCIDLDLNGVDLTDMESTRTMLRKYGLDFILTEEDLEMMVIRDIPAKNKASVAIIK